MADDAKQYALDKHKEWHGKIEVVSRASISTPEELAVAYTPGVAQPCLEIQKDVEDAIAQKIIDCRGENAGHISVSADDNGVVVEVGE